jgi:hypothetical protein
MASAALEAHPQPAIAPLGRSWRLLVAARTCVDGGATRAELAKDLGSLSAHRLSPAELRTALDRAIDSLLCDGCATEQRHRLSLTSVGQAAALEALGIRPAGKPAKLSWSDVRDIRLVALALGLEGEAAAKIKLLARPDGLRAAVLQKTYGLDARSRTSPSRLRAALAVVALQRAFGNSIKDAMDAGAGLSAKAGRLLAGQLAAKPRDFGTDARLITMLAAECAGSPQTDADALRMAILRKLVAEMAPAIPRPVAVAKAPTVTPAMPIATGAPRSAAPIPVAVARPAAATRPDLGGFAQVVLDVARRSAEGWPGNRKAYISDVWLALRTDRPEWGLSEIEFKSMLAEAHRTGHIVLANADLKDRRSLPKVQQSALTFKNTVLHFVRVTD